MIGIYKITNLINNNIYIGQSNNLELRWKKHQWTAFSNTPSNKEWDKPLYQAMRKHGINNFSFEILEECPIEILDEREIYYISKYNGLAYHNYNITSGGHRPPPSDGDNHPRRKLSQKDVEYIRECYNNHISKATVFQEFKDKIGESGFKKIWNNETWKNVRQDVYTEANRQYYLFQRNSHPGSQNGRALLNETDVYNIRKRKLNGETRQKVYEDYKYTGITRGSFDCIWYYQNWKHVVV
jgi:group I intron endonuclease